MKKYNKDIMSAIVIAIALIPESIAFAFVLGVNPVVGIYSSVILGFVTSFLGGRKAMITAATGAVAAVFAPMVSEHGAEYLFWAVILMGIFQLIFAKFNFNKLFRIISKPVLLGAVNGLAFIMLFAQLEQFHIPGSEELLGRSEMAMMWLLISITILIIVFTPKKIKQVVPASLIALVIVTIISIVLTNMGHTIYTVYDVATSSNVSSEGYIASLNMDTLLIVLIPAFSAAVVGLIESLLTLTIIDDKTNTRGDAKKECYAQGIANIVCGLFGGMGGCAMLGQSMINIENGARSYVSTFLASLFLLLIMVFAKPLLTIIPTAVIVGVMFVVIYHTFNFSSVVIHKRGNYFDLFIVITVTLITAITSNLAFGVIIGTIITMIKFSFDKSKNHSIVFEDNHVTISGLLFFGNALKIKEELNDLNINNDVVIDLKRAKILDYTFANELINYKNKLKSFDIDVYFKNVDNDSLNTLNKVGEQD